MDSIKTEVSLCTSVNHGTPARNPQSGGWDDPQTNRPLSELSALKFLEAKIAMFAIYFRMVQKETYL